MPSYTLILYPSLEHGKCYNITGTVTSIGGQTGVATFRMGNVSNSDVIFQVMYTPTVDFGYVLNYAQSKFYDRIIVEAPHDIDITDFSFRLDEQCAATYCSECFKLSSCHDASSEVVYLEWTNDDNAFGIDYTSLKTVHSLHVAGGIRNASYKYDENVYRTSSGNSVIVYADTVKDVELWVHDVPEYIHDALRVAIVHDHFTVNGVEYVKAEGDYVPDWDTPNSLMAPVIIKLREKYQNTKNYKC